MAGLVAACSAGSIPTQVVSVISPVDGTPAVLRAQALGAPVHVVARQPVESYAERLQQVLNEADPDLICLAGYMFLLPSEIIDAYRNRILNIHPALLPKFGGKGMYGIHVHEAVLAAGETESGCTVHWVTENYDEGATVHQKRCPVLPGDTPETLAQRVLDLEPVAYAEAICEVLGSKR